MDKSIVERKYFAKSYPLKFYPRLSIDFINEY